MNLNGPLLAARYSYDTFAQMAFQSELRSAGREVTTGQRDDVPTIRQSDRLAGRENEMYMYISTLIFLTFTVVPVTYNF